MGHNPSAFLHHQRATLITNGNFEASPFERVGDLKRRNLHDGPRRIRHRRPSGVPLEEDVALGTRLRGVENPIVAGGAFAAARIDETRGGFVGLQHIGLEERLPDCCR